MRPARRRLLAGLAGLTLAGVGGVAVYHRLRGLRGGDAALGIEVRAKPIEALLASEPYIRTFGALRFRSGLELTSDAPGFGGLSGLWRDPDGERLVAISDHGQWFTARLRKRGDALAGLTEARLAPILDADGRPLRRTRAYDTEGLAISDGIAWVSSERTQELRRFAWAAQGVLARGIPVPLPDEVAGLPENGGLEAVAVAPRGHPLAGRVVLVAEEAQAGFATPTRGWVVTGEPFAFDVARPDDYDVTDIAFLPTGELLILDRRFTLLSGVACRIRRVAADAIRPGAMLDGPVIFSVHRNYAIDNMEGLAVHRDPGNGETVLSLVSDDNFQPFQRTLLLEFALVG